MDSLSREEGTRRITSIIIQGRNDPYPDILEKIKKEIDVQLALIPKSVTKDLLSILWNSGIRILNDHYHKEESIRLHMKYIGNIHKLFIGLIPSEQFNCISFMSDGKDMILSYQYDQFYCIPTNQSKIVAEHILSMKGNVIYEFVNNDNVKTISILTPDILLVTNQHQKMKTYLVIPKQAIYSLMDQKTNCLSIGNMPVKGSTKYTYITIPFDKDENGVYTISTLDPLFQWISA